MNTKMATDVAGKILQNIFTYEEEIKTFRLWQDTFQDVCVYILITSELNRAGKIKTTRLI